MKVPCAHYPRKGLPAHVTRLIGLCMPWLAALLSSAILQTAFAASTAFSFGVIGRISMNASDDSQLRDAILASDADNLAFVVASGIKAATEPCTDALYLQRKEIFQSAKNGLIVSLAASDWSGCRGTDGRSLAIERLNRVRDLFFGSDFSFGSTKVPTMRQANTPKFRAYVENLRWDIGTTVFATVNLPANNNDFLTAAGRNGEFEDRMVANRDWLHRVFGIAVQKNATGIILFCDGDPLDRPDAIGRIALSGNHDGFSEIRKQLQALSAHFTGRILLVHGQSAAQQASAPDITWRGNLGTVRGTPGWLKITVDPNAPNGFVLDTTQRLKTAVN